MGKIALITGITGQNGSYLAEFLLDKDYEVPGIVRRSSTYNRRRSEHLLLDTLYKDAREKRPITLHYGVMTDSTSLIQIIQNIKPDEICNLAAQSHVKISFDVPEYTLQIATAPALAERNNGPVTAIITKTWCQESDNCYLEDYLKKFENDLLRNITMINYRPKSTKVFDQVKRAKEIPLFSKCKKERRKIDPFDV